MIAAPGLSSEGDFNNYPLNPTIIEESNSSMFGTTGNFAVVSADAGREIDELVITLSNYEGFERFTIDGTNFAPLAKDGQTLPATLNGYLISVSVNSGTSLTTLTVDTTASSTTSRRSRSHSSLAASRTPPCHR